MTTDVAVKQSSRDRYIAANQAALRWQLDRMDPSNPLINTKVNSVTLQDYGAHDGLRGPDYVYGWIQGRGLEAMVLHAIFFDKLDPLLSQQLHHKARDLYAWLNSQFTAQQHACFCYNTRQEPICTADSSGKTRQHREKDIATYSDLFVVKGLIAAAAEYSPDDLPVHLRALQTIITAIDHNRFLVSESSHITESALLEQMDDYGPKMIALGAASLLRRFDLANHDSFSLRFIESIIERHQDAQSGLLRTVIGSDICNVGHCLEFAGFSLEAHGTTLEPIIVRQLGQLILSAFDTGYNDVGLALNIDLATMAPVSDVMPWWSLPETIRAASLAYECSHVNSTLNGSEFMRVWQQSETAFFDHYWQGDPPIAYQTLGANGPVDFVPATPDLDPGYHTGLSLLAAIESVDRQCSPTEQI